MTAALLLNLPTAAQVSADTITTPPPMTQQDLTSTGTVTTAVTGQVDPVYSQYEQPYQAYPITSANDWTGYCRQGGRAVTLQFTAPEEVQSISIQTERNPGMGIYFPSQVEFDGYANGIWYTLGTVTSATSDANGQVQTFTFANSTGVEVSAVRVTFPVKVWVFARGFDVAGSTTSTGQTPDVYGYAPVPTTPVSTSTGPLAPWQANGIRNMLLVYTGAYGARGTWTASDFLPMLQYQGTSPLAGQPLFDTMLFLPYSSGSDTETYWSNYLKDMFKPGQQLDALNQEAAKLGTQEKVVLAVPYFPLGANNFGKVGSLSLSFGNSNTDPDALQARTIATYWYLNNLLLDWYMAGYQNLQLVGLYYDHEQFNLSDPNEQQFFTMVEQTAHQHNLKTFWIPSFGAVGSKQWSSLGLDATWLQTNYATAGASGETTRISSAVNTIEQYGMGIEVELPNLSTTEQPMYQTLLNTLQAAGLEGSQVSHAYYAGSKLLVEAANSTDPAVRNLYDETAQFILGTYSSGT